MTTSIHETAIVSPEAKIGEGCRIGPFCTVGAEVTLGDGVVLDSHVVVDGRTTIGEETHVFPFASVGLAPQDLKYAGEPTATEIGRRNQIREFVTIGNDVIMANAATLAGHVEIADRANVGAYSGVHQFCRVGVEAFIGGYSVVVKDVAPYGVIQGNHAKCYGLNKVGMKRRGYSKDTIEKLNHAYHLLLTAKLNTSQAVERIREEITDCPEVDNLVNFIESSKRGIVK